LPHPVIEAPSLPNPVPAEFHAETKSAAPPAERVPEPVKTVGPDTVARQQRKPKAETVIPLVHAPDDPGPETDLEQDPASGQSPDSWIKRG
jgi:hypothetical protein